ncbi:shikimate dehydrogenase [Brassicibacter mesophilus]|uniref:shikimate dehydrogenase n=1 Tax=Brassicibacter mesophilus TaxID=745119 RepID=UPI003D19020F
MSIDADTKLFCLLGHPISKSLSPIIHNYSFEENEINARYVAFDVDKNALEYAVNGIKALNIQGFNVTIPHKVDIIKLLDEIDEEASLLGAVNTVKNVNGKLTGFNTDGRGFIQALQNNNIDIKDKNITIIGAGGAARAITMTMAKDGARSIQVANRTVEKAKKIAYEISSKFQNVVTSWTDIQNINTVDMDIVVNCTSVGMYPDAESFIIDPCIFNKNALICDIVYKPTLTKFLNVAKQSGYRIMGGIDMLIYQAILSEQIWLDKKINSKFFTEKKKDIFNIL